MLSKNTTLIELIFVEIYRFKGENRRFTPAFYTEPHRKAFAGLIVHVPTRIVLKPN